MDRTTTVYPLQQNTNVDVGATPVEVLVEGNNQTVESTTQPNPVEIIVPDVTVYTVGVQGPPGPPTGLFEDIMDLPFVGSGTGSTKTVTDINENVIFEKFGINDELFVVWVLPSGLDRTKPCSFEGSFFPTGSEVGTDCSWEIHITAHTHIDGDITGIVYANGLPLNEIAFKHSHGAAVIDNTIYLLEDVNILHIKLKRVISTNDPADKVGVSDLSMRFATEGKVGEQGAAGTTEDDMPYARQIDFEGNYIYKGKASPGALVSAAAWEIQRIEKVVGGDGKTDYSYTYAAVTDNEPSQTNIWDDRLTLTYS